MLFEASKKLGNSSYYLDRDSNLYNKMSDWNKLVQILNKEFGDEITDKIVGKNALKFLQKHLH